MASTFFQSFLLVADRFLGRGDDLWMARFDVGARADVDLQLAVEFLGNRERCDVSFGPRDGRGG